MSQKHQGSERRKHPRFNIMEGMVEPISIQFGPDAHPNPHEPHSPVQPAILTDLSAGGMSLIVFLEPPKAKKFEMVINLPGLKRIPVEGEIVSVTSKGETHKVGISFTKISAKHQKELVEMAEDDLDCETRISLRLPEVCIPGCSFHCLCVKTQKGPYWKESTIKS